jgi:hypothetical protein
MKRNGENFVNPYAGDVVNRKVPSIINIMIIAVFSFGDYES